MHHLFGMDDFPAKDGTDRLMPKTDTEYRFPACEMPQHFHGDACLIRRFRSWRDTDMVWIQLLDFFNGDLIVAVSLHICAQFAELLDDVVCKRIVVVYHQ